MKKVTTALLLTLSVSLSMNIAVAQDDEDIVLGAALEDVTNLEVTVEGDSELTLSWDAVAGATGYIIHYGTEPVEAGEIYNRPPLEAGDVTEYTVGELVNAVTYYFSVVAADGDGEFSASYSDEVSGVPMGDGIDEPTFVAAEATNNTTVRMAYSGTPDLGIAEGLSIIKTFDDTELAVISVVVDNGALLVTTATQDPGTEYRITLGDISETFLGSSVSGAVDDEFQVVGANAGDLDKVEITFSKEILLGANPTAEIAIVKTEDPSQSLEVTNVIRNPQDGMKILIETGDQEAVEYTLLITAVTDLDGSGMSDANSTYEFLGFGLEEGDTTPPEEVTGLAGSVVDLTSVAVSLSWGASANSAEDLASYLVYLSTDRGATYELLNTLQASSLGVDATGLAEAEFYKFKVTAKDETGNESVGKTVELPGTGPGGLVLLALGSLAGARLSSRKRK